ncbi:MAG TPA: SUMF1/EgtB/PvdO family nonheme iron enzyme, partial [Candidatus Kapabacteria bacterium]|nr:SUMF1/EgtB/PvdO family nonheme iron enzyme [Candidatus Kapabacteria bacterium]
MTQQVFISYSNENETDRQVADKIYDTLKARGIPCWVAHRDIDAGQNWPDEISKAISNSRAMIVVLSEYTQKSRYVGREVTQAADENLTIIPFCIEKVSLSGGLKLLLSNCQWINAFPHLQDKDVDRLVETLHRNLGIESRETFKKVEKLPEVDIKSTEKKVHHAKKSLRLKPVLAAALIIIAVIALFIYISQWVNYREPSPEPDFINDLKSKGWGIKNNENGFWEAFYKTYDFTMIYIPPGKFMMGADNGNKDEKPVHEVGLDGYWIGKYEVTFAQFDQYCEEIGRKMKPDDEDWGREKRPVINVSWDDAVAYCKWLSQETGLTFQLPTEAQCEKAARGTEGLVYPWGNEFDKNKCNSSASGANGTVPVGTYPSGKSPYGCMDMAGNVWEWCSDWYDKDYYKNSPAKNPRGPSTGTYRALRGGSWYYRSFSLRCAARSFL